MLLILTQLMLLHLQIKAKTRKQKHGYLRWNVYVFVGVLLCSAIHYLGPKLLGQ